MVNCHTDWSTRAFGLSPVAPDTGPFPERAFLEALWSNQPVGELCLAESESALIPLVQGEFGLRWVGHPDLVDYRSPLGQGAADLIAELVGTSEPGTRFQFDSLPGEAAAEVGRGLARAGRLVEPQQHAMTARLLLPGSFGAYLEKIGKKERHEIRRKRRRFREEHGTPTVAATRGPGVGFDHFVGMHRSSSGTKGSFMTAQMEALFAALAAQDGWQVDLLLGEDGKPVAAVFSWADGDGF
jgi:CelD/BcsL family acetyltransferase involved in cellulose biosynthesis